VEGFGGAGGEWEGEGDRGVELVSGWSHLVPCVESESGSWETAGRGLVGGGNAVELTLST